MTADSFFGGAPSISWARNLPNGGWEDIPELLGVIMGGLVVDVGEPVQMRKMGTNELIWWKEPSPENPKGEPKMKLVITLRCDGTGRPGGKPSLDMRNHVDPADNGDRLLHVQSKELRDAIRSAYRKVGAQGVRQGSELYVAWTGYRESKIKGAHAARTFASLYVQREVPVDGGRPEATQNGAPANPFGTPTAPPAQQVATPAAPPAQQPAAPAAPAGPPANPFGAPAQQVPATTGAAPSANPFG